MAKNIFTPEFYKEMYDKLMKRAKNYSGDNYEKAIEGSPVAEDCYVGEYYVTIDEVCFDKEWVDESFDHAFGTWHDPNAGYEITGICDIDEIHVYESDDSNAAEIDGFDVEAFFKANE